MGEFDILHQRQKGNSPPPPPLFARTWTGNINVSIATFTPSYGVQYCPHPLSITWIRYLQLSKYFVYNFIILLIATILLRLIFLLVSFLKSRVSCTSHPHEETNSQDLYSMSSIYHYDSKTFDSGH